MIKILILVTLLLGSFFQVFAQTKEITSDSLKKEAYLAYLVVKEKEILQNKEERMSLEVSLIELDSLLRLAKEERNTIEKENKMIRLDVNRVETGVSTHQDALVYNKQEMAALNQAQLESKKQVDLSRVQLSESRREYKELELILSSDKEKIEKKTIDVRTQEEQVQQLGIEFKERENLVEVNTSAVTSLTISLDDASRRQDELKLEIDATQHRVDELATELIDQRTEVEGAENKIADNKKKLESNSLNASSWEKQLSDVTQRIANLENNRKDKKNDLDILPDSLKTSEVLLATQEEVRMINDQLKIMNKEVFQLNQDISQLKEISRLIQAENENLENERNISQSRLKSLQEDKYKEEEKFREQRDNKQTLVVKIHDLSVEKEQVHIALQKAENGLSYYKGEYTRRKEQLAKNEADQEFLREKVGVNQKKKDSVEIERNKLTEGFNLATSKNAQENKELGKLKNQKHALVKDLDSLVSENRQISHRQKVAQKELELSSEEVAKHEEDKQLMNERIQELTNDTEDDILKGIEEAKNGQFENFITTLNVVLEKDKSSATSHTLIGYTHYIQGDLDQAEDAYTSAINESPRVITPYVLRAELREDRDNYNGALKDYNQVVYLDSTKGDAYFKQGLLLYYFLNEQDEGCKSWEMAFKLGVEDANEKLIEHCSESSTSQFYVITQLTKRAIKETYGYDISNPIMVGKNEERQDYNVILYLQLLRDKQGKPVDFVRYGSCCRYSTENGLRGEGLMERYRISYKNEKGKKEQKTLYFSFYDFDKPKVPKGFDTNHDIY